jgi:CubicO group peptidase (beta-lactamase class C family)
VTVIKVSSAVALLVTLLAGCGSGRRQHAEPIPSTRTLSSAPLELEDGWTVAAAQDVGLDACLLDSMTSAIQRREEFVNLHAVLIVKDDRLVYEEYFAGEDRRWQGEKRETVSLSFGPDTLHDIRSAGKSVTSALVGIAVSSGAIESLDQSLFSFFPEHSDLATPEKRRVTLRHALTMSAGLDWNEGQVPYTDPTNDAERMEASTEPVRFLLNRPVASEPGSTWSYNSGMPVLLGLAISRATGRPFGAYARDVLFEPLGITDVEWSGPRAWSDIHELEWDGGQPWARVAQPGGSLWLRPRDVAKFGSLYLNGGRWNGRQVLPAEWVEESTRRRIPVTDAVSEYGEHGYGYLWWHDRFRTPGGELEVISAVGNGEQRIFVVPSLDLVVVHVAGRYNDPDAAWMSERLLLNHIVPAVQRGNVGGASLCGSFP